MSALCPNCGCALPAPAQTAHRGELERQLGDVAKAADLRARAKEAHERHGRPVRLAGTEFVAWRSYVWAEVRVRKAAICLLTGLEIRPGSWAWRQLSEVRDRDARVLKWDAL